MIVLNVSIVSVFCLPGKNPQRKGSGDPKEFDIAAALNSRKPLRKTSTALAMDSKS